MDRKHRRKLKRRRRNMILWGTTSILVGLAVMSRVLYFYMHSQTVGNHLLQQANKMIVNQPVAPPRNLVAGKLFGKVMIPDLSLEAPLVQGINDEELAIGVGHLPTSVLPGQSGTALIAAHNATWFRHIDELKPGSEIVLETSYGTFSYKVTRSQIHHVGDAIENATQPSLALETCYPLNALYLTPNRYFVFADLVKETKPHATVLRTEKPITYTVTIPKSLQNDNLTLNANSLPMGSLEYVGHPRRAFTQSDAPLSASKALVTLYLAWVHANAKWDVHTLSQLEKSNLRSPLIGVSERRYEYLSPFDITLKVEGDHLVSLSAHTDIRITHRFSIDIQAVAAPDNKIELQSIKVDRLY